MIRENGGVHGVERKAQNGAVEPRAFANRFRLFPSGSLLKTINAGQQTCHLCRHAPQSICDNACLAKHNSSCPLNLSQIDFSDFGGSGRIEDGLEAVFG